MPIEKERKFLLKNPEIIDDCKSDIILQGYLIIDGEKQLRVRIIDHREAFLTYKKEHKLFRDEYEYQIPLQDGLELLASTKIKLVKRRYHIFNNNEYDIIVDVYDSGLAIVEIEFINKLDYIPEYCGDEITNNPEYSNIQIALKTSNML